MRAVEMFLGPDHIATLTGLLIYFVMSNVFLYDYDIAFVISRQKDLFLRVKEHVHLLQ